MPEESKNAMKIARLPILNKEDVKERIAHLGANMFERIKADQLANLYSEWLKEVPADVDLVGVYVEDNQMTSMRGLVFRLTGSLFFGFACFDWGQP
jgi:hypothetical protein